VLAVPRRPARPTMRVMQSAVRRFSFGFASGINGEALDRSPRPKSLSEFAKTTGVGCLLSREVCVDYIALNKLLRAATCQADYAAYAI